MVSFHIIIGVARTHIRMHFVMYAVQPLGGRVRVLVVRETFSALPSAGDAGKVPGAVQQRAEADLLRWAGLHAGARASAGTADRSFFLSFHFFQIGLIDFVPGYQTPPAI